MPDCSQPLGMESKRIPDSAITASSQLRQSHSASRARLRMQPAGWSAARKNKKQWLQIYLGAPYIISAIATQGLGRSKSRGEWVTKYKVSYSEDGQKWKIYKRAGKTKVLWKKLKASLKPWPNGLASRRKSTQVWKTRTYVRTCEGWTNGFANRLASRKTFHAYNWLLRFYNNRLIAINLCRLALGDQTVKKLASTCV